MDTNRREFIDSCLSLSLIPFLGTEPENELLKFCRDKLNVKLIKWQEEELLHMFDNTFYHYSQDRGMGNSYLLSVFAMCNFYLNANSRIIVTSSNRRCVNNVLNICKQIYNNSGFQKYDGYATCFIEDTSGITFSTSSGIIRGLSLNEDYIRGFRPNILLIDLMSSCEKDKLHTIIAGMCCVQSNPLKTIKSGKLVYDKPFHIIGSC